jgi:tyrosine-protein phosphatase SIW14
MGLALAVFLIFAPYLYYRYSWEHGKRLRPIDEGRVYRSGLLSADGFRDAIARYRIKTVINLMEENQDPALRADRFHAISTHESELCKDLGVDFKFIFVELSDNRPGNEALPAIAEFRKIMDDESSYPVLIHCKAGLHRTGVMAAIYRMEYDHWSRADAMRELRANGFGHFIANTNDPYIVQYVMRYQPRWQRMADRTVPGRLAAHQKPASRAP